ncbi:hypothetical protein BJ878DRAFT_105534 [Calycina marina]|uniref:WW domain-containing protein n=1 Tax=Calycina marina TaxID=1763456 RepID=A0A9P8CE54_9HELO|nr:hypothetical protein BJ878DRAFT_105534 [Calycina marina]
MLKSTHKPIGGSQQLAEGWTEHKAPTGHLYYYNAATKQSTYTRPAAPVDAPTPIAPIGPSQSFLQYQSVGPGFPQGEDRGSRGGFQGNRGGRPGNDRPRPQPTDRPKSRHLIPGFEPWVLVHTKLGRRFVFHTEKQQSYWRIPDKLKDGILQLDQQRIKEKTEALQKTNEPVSTGEAPGAAERPEVHNPDGDDSSEYEEVEVTDDEDDENPTKRQKTFEIPDEPIEYNEDDIAFQLATMGEEYGLDPGEYDDGNMENWEEGAAGLELTEEDAVALFRDLLNDAAINPFSPWEKLVEEGKLVDDTRYTALTSMKARKETWDEWSREKMKAMRYMRAKEEKKDPRIPYLSFLQQNANPKLYWPEFRRKFKKEAVMRDTSMTDKDREKYYREHIKRLALPSSTLKTDLLALLKDQPLSKLNRSSNMDSLPPAVLGDIRFISMDPSTRDGYVEAFITTLNPAPEIVEAEDSEEIIRMKKEKERRQKALNDREAFVREEKRKQQRDLQHGKGVLRYQELELERAMQVNKKGLKGQLVGEGADVMDTG